MMSKRTPTLDELRERMNPIPAHELSGEQFPTLDELRQRGFEFELVPSMHPYPVQVIVVHSWDKNKDDKALMAYLRSGLFQNYAAPMLGMPWDQSPGHVVPHDVTYRETHHQAQLDLFPEAA